MITTGKIITAEQLQELGRLTLLCEAALIAYTSAKKQLDDYCDRLRREASSDRRAEG